MVTVLVKSKTNISLKIITSCYHRFQGGGKRNDAGLQEVLILEMQNEQNLLILLIFVLFIFLFVMMHCFSNRVVCSGTAGHVVSNVRHLPGLWVIPVPQLPHPLLLQQSCSSTLPTNLQLLLGLPGASLLIPSSTQLKLYGLLVIPGAVLPHEETIHWGCFDDSVLSNLSQLQYCQ